MAMNIVSAFVFLKNVSLGDFQASPKRMRWDLKFQKHMLAWIFEMGSRSHLKLIMSRGGGGLLTTS